MIKSELTLASRVGIGAGQSLGAKSRQAMPRHLLFETHASGMTALTASALMSVDEHILALAGDE